MVSTPRKTAVQSVDPQFSLLTCLFVGGCFLFLETCVDLACHVYGDKQGKLYWLFLRADIQFLDFIKMPHSYAYGIMWWLPVFIGCFCLGYRLGWHSLLYSVCGVAIYLIITHNFRGITQRHNVFELADTIQRLHSMGQWQNLPSPLFYDIGYIVVALVGSIIGWLSRLPMRKLKATDWNIGSIPTLWLGYACIVLGVIETLITLFIVQREDIYINLPITHCYALMAFGLIMIGAVQYRQRLSEILNFEIV